jgi:hypothetical protein
LSQTKPFGQLKVLIGSSSSDTTIKINGKVAISEQTIVSPSVVETPFGTTELLVSFHKNWRIKLDPDAKINLVFDENKITGELLKGNLTISARPNTILNIQTKDGVITFPNINQENNVFIDSVKGKTRIRTLAGLAALNGTLVAEGQYFIAGELNVNNVDSRANSYFYSYLFIPAGLLLLAMSGYTNTGDTNIDTMQTNVGPIR